MRFILLDFMRFVLALFVALGHFKGYFAIPRAYLAVDFFFILSGFVLTYAYLPNASDTNFVKKFAIARVARLYPLHFATLVILVFLNSAFFLLTGSYLEQGWSYQDGYFYTFVLNLFLAQNIGITTSTSWNAPSWSISAELWINLALALCMPFFRATKRVFLISLLLATSFGAYYILYVTYGHLREFTRNIYGIANSGLTRCIAGIALGIVLYYVFDILRGTYISKIGKMVLLFLSAVGLAGSIFIICYDGRFGLNEFSCIPIFSITIFFSAMAEYMLKPQQTLLMRTLKHLGNLSYAIYMIHWLLQVFLAYIVGYAYGIDYKKDTFSTGCIYVICLVILSHFTFVHLEMPLKKALNTLLRGRLIKQPIPLVQKQKHATI